VYNELFYNFFSGLFGWLIDFRNILFKYLLSLLCAIQYCTVQLLSVLGLNRLWLLKGGSLFRK